MSKFKDGADEFINGVVPAAAPEEVAPPPKTRQKRRGSGAIAAIKQEMESGDQSEPTQKLSVELSKSMAKRLALASLKTGKSRKDLAIAALSDLLDELGIEE